jgi:hypothetical protein
VASFGAISKNAESRNRGWPGWSVFDKRSAANLIMCSIWLDEAYALLSADHRAIAASVCGASMAPNSMSFIPTRWWPHCCIGYGSISGSGEGLRGGNLGIPLSSFGMYMDKLDALDRSC